MTIRCQLTPMTVAFNHVFVIIVG